MNSGFAVSMVPIPGSTLTDQLTGRPRTSLPCGNGFSQTSRHVHFEGLLTGRGGICAARATRL